MITENIVGILGCQRWSGNEYHTKEDHADQVQVQGQRTDKKIAASEPRRWSLSCETTEASVHSSWNFLHHALP